MTDEEDLAEFHLYVAGPTAGVDFLVDSLSITEIPTDMTWRNSAQDRINQIRKGTLNIVINPLRERNLVVQVSFFFTFNKFLHYLKTIFVVFHKY